MHFKKLTESNLISLKFIFMNKEPIKRSLGFAVSRIIPPSVCH